MWKVYCPAWVNATDGKPYEAYSYTFPGLVQEMEYIGMFLGRAFNERTFAVFINKEFVK